jgi:hypothetical protein
MELFDISNCLATDWRLPYEADVGSRKSCFCISQVGCNSVSSNWTHDGRTTFHNIADVRLSIIRLRRSNGSVHLNENKNSSTEFNKDRPPSTRATHNPALRNRCFRPRRKKTPKIDSSPKLKQGDRPLPSNSGPLHLPDQGKDTKYKAGGNSASRV